MTVSFPILLARPFVYGQPSPGSPQGLRVSPNKRYLEREDGTSFFYLGDMAWELFHRLNCEEAEFVRGTHCRF